MTLSDKKLHKIGRIDQVVQDYFASNRGIDEVMAKELMPLFTKKGIFLRNPKEGLYIRNLLRELDAIKNYRYLRT